jgi:hypothetical protein
MIQWVLRETLRRTEKSVSWLAAKIGMSEPQLRKHLKGEVPQPHEKTIGAILRAAREAGVEIPASQTRPPSPPMSDREIGRLQGRLEQAEKDMRVFADRIRGVMENRERIVASHVAPSGEDGRRERTPGDAAGAHGPTTPVGRTNAK